MSESNTSRFPAMEKLCNVLGLFKDANDLETWRGTPEARQLKSQAKKDLDKGASIGKRITLGEVSLLISSEKPPTDAERAQLPILADPRKGVFLTPFDGGYEALWKEGAKSYPFAPAAVAQRYAYVAKRELAWARRFVEWFGIPMGIGIAYLVSGGLLVFLSQLFVGAVSLLWAFLLGGMMFWMLDTRTKLRQGVIGLERYLHLITLPARQPLLIPYAKPKTLGDALQKPAVIGAVGGVLLAIPLFFIPLSVTKFILMAELFVLSVAGIPYLCWEEKVRKIAPCGVGEGFSAVRREKAWRIWRQTGEGDERTNELLDAYEEFSTLRLKLGLQSLDKDSWDKMVERRKNALGAAQREPLASSLRDEDDDDEGDERADGRASSANTPDQSMSIVGAGG